MKFFFTFRWRIIFNQIKITIFRIKWWKITCNKLLICTKQNFQTSFVTKYLIEFIIAKKWSIAWIDKSLMYWKLMNWNLFFSIYGFLFVKFSIRSIHQYVVVKNLNDDRSILNDVRTILKDFQMIRNDVQIVIFVLIEIDIVFFFSKNTYLKSNCEWLFLSLKKGSTYLQAESLFAS